jgi:GNAT superfamily N-acetyltransferase
MIEAVRPLAAGDVAAMASLEAAARRDLVGQRGGPQLLAESPEVGDWSGLVGRASHPVWVGTIDDVVVGYLELTIDATTAVVRQVYVQPEARELGFGDDMLAAAFAAARSAGCTVLEGTALPGNREMKNLYERAGVKARKIIVSIPL